MNKTLLTAWLISLALPIHAHEGEDHGPPPPPPVVSEAGPRAAAVGDEFELVAVLEDARLKLYLDRYATNEPVLDAHVELESGRYKAVASPAGPGVYTLPADAFRAPGHYPLSISVTAGETADLLAATLTVGEPAAAPAAGQTSWLPWAGAGAALLVAAAHALRRRSRRKPG